MSILRKQVIQSLNGLSEDNLQFLLDLIQRFMKPTKIEEKNNKWEEKPSDITLEDIDEEALRNFIKKGKEKGRISYDYTNKDWVGHIYLLNYVFKKFM